MAVEEDHSLRPLAAPTASYRLTSLLRRTSPLAHFEPNVTWPSALFPNSFWPKSLKFFCFNFHFTSQILGMRICSSYLHCWWLVTKKHDNSCHVSHLFTLGSSGRWLPRARDEHRSGLKALALLNAKALQQGLALETVQRTWRCSEGYYMLLLHITNYTIKLGCYSLSSHIFPTIIL
jgi:hypothetical protein